MKKFLFVFFLGTLSVYSVFSMGLSEGAYKDTSMGPISIIENLWLILVIAYFIGCLALGGWLASEKGYSVGSDSEEFNGKRSARSD